MNKRNWVFGIMLTLCLGWILPGLSAQEMENNFGMVYIVEGYPDKIDELYEAIKDHAEWREDHGDPWSWDVYQVVVGEGLTNFEIVSFGHNLEDFDAYQEFLDKGSEKWREDVMPYISKITNLISMLHWDCTNWPEGTANDYVMIMDFLVKPGQQWKLKDSFMQVHKTMMEEEHPVHYSFHTNFAGGDREVATIAIPASSYAELAGPDESVWDLMVRVHGEDKAGEVFGDMDSSSVKKEIYILKKLPDLCVTAAED